MFRSPLALTCVASAALLAACGGGDDLTPPAPVPAFQSELRMTTYGVPHVKADNFASLGHGVAQAYMRENFCVLADQVVTVNGERAKYHGESGTATVSFVSVPNVDSDFFHKSYFDDAALKAAWDKTSEDARELVRGYIEGYNEYLQAAAFTASDSLPPPRNTCDRQPWVRPIDERDFLRLLAAKAALASGGAFARAIATAQPPEVTTQKPGSRPDRQARARKLDRDVVLAQLNPYYVRGAASNAYAIGKQGTTNGAGMLLGNPHYPWGPSTAQFFEVHMTVPGKLDVFGGMNGDFPLPLVGFNADIAWTHTVSPALRQTIFELTLDPDSPTRYLYGNEVRDLIAKPITIEVKQDNGVVQMTRTLYSSHLGPMLNISSLVPGGVNLLWTKTTAYSMRDANANSMRLMEQWLRFGRATSVGDIEKSLREVAATSYVHTVAVDRNGDTLSADISHTPNVSAAMLQPEVAGGCVRGKTAQAILSLVNLPILNGSRVECDWSVEDGAPAPGLMPTAKLPAVKRADYVANANQSQWFAHPDARIDELEPILGGGKTPLSLRQRMVFSQIEQRLQGKDGLSPTPGFDSLETMRQVLFGNRVLAAELVMPQKSPAQLVGGDLIPECTAPIGANVLNVIVAAGPFAGQTVDIAPACAVLQAWDGRANLDSVGTVLFREFWRRLKLPANVTWINNFNLQDPVHTPSNLNTGNPAVREALQQALAETVADLSAKGLDINKPLKDLQAVTRDGKRIPLPGDDEHVGAPNKLTMLEPQFKTLTGAGYTEVFAGASYIQAVTWVNNQVQARGVLAYSQSNNANSKHRADQTEALFSAGKLAVLPFSEADIAAAQEGSTEKIVSKRLR